LAYTGFNAPAVTGVVAVAFSADGKFAATTCGDHVVRVFKVEK
jgi:hypothetical protein